MKNLQFFFIITLYILSIISTIMPVVACTTYTVGAGGNLADLKGASDIAFGSAGDIFSLNSDVNLTNQTASSAGYLHMTNFSKSATIVGNGFTIYCENQTYIQKGATLTITGPVYFKTVSAGAYSNNSLFEFGGGTNTLTFNNGVFIDASPSTNVLSVINMSNNNGTLNGAATTGLTIISETAGSVAFNITGESNTIQLTTYPNVTTAFGVYITPIAHYSRITIPATFFMTPGGKIWLARGAKMPVITDAGTTTLPVFAGNTTWGAGAVQQYTRNVPNNVIYVYNSTQSLSGRNLNFSVAVPQLFPLAGPETGLNVHLKNITDGNLGVSGYWYNESHGLKLNATSGGSGGVIWNTTGNALFAKAAVNGGNGKNPAFILPVNFTFNDSAWFNGKFGGTTGGYTVNTTVLVNFNPIDDANPGTGLAFNRTQTTNWSAITDFGSAVQVNFTVESSTTGTLYENLSYTEPLDLTNESVGQALGNFGDEFKASNAGDILGFQFTNPVSRYMFSKGATLKFYPTAVNTGDPINIYHIGDDGATQTLLYSNGNWAGNAGTYVDTTTLVTGTTNVTFNSKIFSRYQLTQYAPAAPSASTSSESEGQSAASAKQAAAASTVSVNVGGNSAIGKASVTGKNAANAVVTATTTTLPPGMSPPESESVYQYMDVSVGGGVEVEKIAFDFSVPKSWIEEKGYTPFDIIMTTNVNGKWDNLPTVLVKEDSSTAYYNTEVNHASIFAIIYVKGATVDTSKSNASATAAPTTEIPTPAVTTATPSPMGTATAPETPVPTTVPTQSPGFAAVSAFASLGAVAYLAARKN